MKRLSIFILVLVAVVIFGINAYKENQNSGAEGCYAHERFVLPDVCIGDCGEGEICKVYDTRGYIFGLFQQPSDCICTERGKSASGSMGETGMGATGTVIPPDM